MNKKINAIEPLTEIKTKEVETEVQLPEKKKDEKKTEKRTIRLKNPTKRRRCSSVRCVITNLRKR